MQKKVMSMARPVFIHVKGINVSMMISCQEAVSSGVEGQLEETHRLCLLGSSADHRQHQAEEAKRNARH